MVSDARDRQDLMHRQIPLRFLLARSDRGHLRHMGTWARFEVMVIPAHLSRSLRLLTP